MAIAGVLLISENNTSTTASYTFPLGAFTNTPTQGLTAIIGVGNRIGSGTATLPTLNNLGGYFNTTWTQIDTKLNGQSNTSRLTLFRGTLAASGVPNTFNADFGGTNQVQCQVIVLQFTGLTQTTNEGIVQSANGAASGQNVSVTLNAFADGNNATALWAGGNSTPTSWTAKSGYTSNSLLLGILRMGQEWIASNDTNPTATWVSAGGWSAIAVELDGSQTKADSPTFLATYKTRPYFFMRGLLLNNTAQDINGPFVETEQRPSSVISSPYRTPPVFLNRQLFMNTAQDISAPPPLAEGDNLGQVIRNPYNPPKVTMRVYLRNVMNTAQDQNAPAPPGGGGGKTRNTDLRRKGLTLVRYRR